MTHQPNFAPADFSILSSNEPQNSEIDGAGNPASSPTTVTDSEWASNAEDVGSRPSGGSGVTIAPPQVPDPTHRLTGNYDNALRDNLHSGTDVGSPFLSTQQNTLTFDDSSPAPSFLESSLTAQPPATPNYYPETSSHGHLSYPAHLRLTPNEARPQIDDLHDGIQHASVPPIQAAIRRDAPPVLPFVAHGAGERFEDAWPWLTTGTERDGVALMHRIAHKFRLQVNIAPAPPSVSWLPPQPFPNPSTIHPASTLPEFGGAGTGHSAEIPYVVSMPYAQMKNPYPVPIVAEQRPVSWFPPQCFPSSSTTHPSTTHPSTSRSDFGDHSAAVDFSNAHTNWPSASSATSPQGNSGFQLPSSSPGFNHGATPAFYPDSSRLYRMLVESTPPAKIPPTLPAIPHCEPGHELMPFTREHDTNPSPSTQAAFESGAPFGAHHAVGHGKYTAVKRRASIKAGKSGQCSQCPVTVSPLWRTHPHTGSPLCNACGQKARSKKRR